MYLVMITILTNLGDIPPDYATITRGNMVKTCYGPLLPKIPRGSVQPTDNLMYEAAFAFFVSKSLS